MDEQPKAYEHYLEEDPTGACRSGCIAVAFVVAVIVIVAFIGWRLGY
jgi:hypothetical protein